MIRYDGRTTVKTTCPGKPIETGIRVWVLAEKGFFLSWFWNEKSVGPIGVPRPRPKRTLIQEDIEIQVNPTQMVVPALLETLPYRQYKVILDNLFVSEALMLRLRQRGWGALGTARPNSGIVEDILHLKKTDGKEGFREMQWGEVVTAPTESNKVNNMAFKDNAVVLFQSNYHTGEGHVLRRRKRPKKTSGKAKTARIPFGDQPTKTLPLPTFDDEYNYGMGAVDLGDQLKSYNAGLRLCRRGGWHAMWQWMLNTVLVNCYLISRHFKVSGKQHHFTDQSTFRNALIDALLSEGTANLGELGARKRAYPRPNPAKIRLSATTHSRIHRGRKNNCANCAGERYGDPPRKRAALSVVAVNMGRRTVRKGSNYGCKQCNVALCKEGDCWQQYHSI